MFAVERCPRLRARACGYHGRSDLVDLGLGECPTVDQRASVSNECDHRRIAVPKSLHDGLLDGAG
jgi:hypothetical protein